MTKLLSAAYAAVAYAIFLLSFLYAIGFVGNFVVPRSVDVSPTSLDTVMAILLNLGLLGVFALQHSIMARPAFKTWWTKMVPKHIERSTFVLLTSVILLGTFWFWAPMTSVVWSVENPLLRNVIWGVFALGWLIVLLSTYMINHFELFGLQQVYLYLKGEGPRPSKFQMNFLYRFVRHPIMSGFIIAFWAAPTMSTGHLLFALTTTIYIYLGTKLEERDLVAYIGPEYEEYKKKVPAFFPGGPRSKS